ncbi:MAG: GGDEF domain-containing protein [Burkholderiaceae bacterium]|nr:GGDEF domain-containing protein [Burkholderiaceae bacterium]
MALDTHSLLVAYTVNVAGVALGLSLVLGLRASRAALAAQAGVLAHALGWLCLVASDTFAGRWPDLLLSTLAMAAMSSSLLLLLQAVRIWRGQAPLAPGWHAAALLMPLLYALGFAHYPWRVGLANGVLAAQMAWVVVEAARPGATGSWRWRGLICASMGTMALVTLWRGVLGAFFTEAYPTFQTPHPVNLVGALGNNVATLLTAIGVLAAFREEAEAQLKTLAITDGLTRLLNRRAWTERAEVLLADARRYGHPLIMLMIDLDHFKQVNDQRGHATGDQALQLTAAVLGETVRSGDLVGRYGGEEFCVLLSHTQEGAALAFDQRLRRRLRQRSEQELGFLLAYSAGLTAHRAQDRSLEDLLRRADAALYEAKRAGRNQLVMSP